MSAEGIAYTLRSCRITKIRAEAGCGVWVKMHIPDSVYDRKSTKDACAFAIDFPDVVANAIMTILHQLDEARREVCAHEADTQEDQREYAKQRGWDCFAEEVTDAQR